MNQKELDSWLDYIESLHPFDSRRKERQGSIDLSGLKISRRDLSNVNLEGANLQNAQLYCVSLDGAYLRDVNFEGARLSKCDFGLVDLCHANLNNTYAVSSSFDSATLLRANARNADFSHVNFHEAYLDHVDFTNSVCKDAIFTRSSLVWTTFTNANLDGTCLDPSLSRESIQELKESPLIAYRTHTSKHVGNNVYEVGQTYFAPVMSWCPVTRCHPGLYAYLTKRAVMNKYPEDVIIEVEIPAGSWVYTREDAVRCRTFTVLRIVRNILDLSASFQEVV